MILARTLIGAAALSLSALGAHAMSMTVVDFNTDNNGTTTAGTGLDGTLFSSFGITNISTTGANGLALYNTECGVDFFVSCTGGDPDLATGPSFGTGTGTPGMNVGNTGQGRALITQADDTDVPNDLLGTYTFTFEFLLPVSIKEIQIIDLEDNEDVSFDVELSDSTVLENIAFTATQLGSVPSGDNSLTGFSPISFLTDVSKLEVNFLGTSGAINSVTYAPVPLPAALPLALGGIAMLGGLGFVRRKA